jgi:hypothetical protein
MTVGENDRIERFDDAGPADARIHPVGRRRRVGLDPVAVERHDDAVAREALAAHRMSRRADHDWASLRCGVL